MNLTQIPWGLIFVTITTFACKSADTPAAQPAPNSRKNVEEASLRATDLAWSDAARRKDLDSLMTFMADDGETLPPNEPAARGKDAVRAGWVGLLGLPGVDIRWEPQRLQVAESGDLGYTSGVYTLSFDGPDGKRVSDRGKYLEVWKRIDGQWKCVSDAYNSDLPAQ